MRGLLVETFAGCKIVEDRYSDDVEYRVVDGHGRCIETTSKIDRAYEIAETFAKAYQSCTDTTA